MRGEAGGAKLRAQRGEGGGAPQEVTELLVLSVAVARSQEVQQQLLVSVMCRWMRMTTASHQSASLRSSIARSARSRSTMWSAAVAFVAPTHHVARTCGETERETAKRHLRAKRGVLMRAGGLPHACRRPHGYT